MSFAPEPISVDTWPAIFALIEPGLARADYTARDLVDELLDGTAQLWVLRADGAPIAAAVTELAHVPAGLTVHGRLLAGRNMAGWLDDALECVTRHAKAVGAVGITVSGRRGWERLLARRGWRFHELTMQFDMAEGG